MSLLQALFGSKKTPSASVAKDRLQLIIARERSGPGGGPVDFLPKLQQELLAVIAKYVQVDPDSVKVEMDRRQNLDLLAINIALPERPPEKGR